MHDLNAPFLLKANAGAVFASYLCLLKSGDMAAHHTHLEQLIDITAVALEKAAFAAVAKCVRLVAVPAGLHSKHRL